MKKGKKVEFNEPNDPYEYRILSQSQGWWPLKSDKKLEDINGLAIEASIDFCGIKESEETFKQDEQFWVDVRKYGKIKKLSAIIKYDGKNFVPGKKSLKINAIQCPKCKDVIFSRTRHDYRDCTCKEIAIDGGFDYVKYCYKDFVPISVPLCLEVTKTDLYNDWNHYDTKYGKMKPQEALQFIDGDIQVCFNGEKITIEEWLKG